MDENNSNKTILVIEDDKLQKQALSEKLKNEGFGVLLAQDGAEGLKIALEKHPDVIILDILMPVMDGATFLDEIRKDSWGNAAKIIILTNFDADNEMISKIVIDQPTYYLMKSEITLEEVVQKIQELLRAEPSSPGE